MSALPRIELSPDAYLDIEREAAYRSEYRDGTMVAMVGASREHNLIVTNLVVTLGTQLKGRRCEIYANDMLVRVPSRRLYAYPDVVIVCGEPQLVDERGDTLLNPTVIIEVLSDSTASYDRGKKFDHYRTLPSLADYLLVSQREPRVEHFVRQPGELWPYTAQTDPQDVARLASIGCELRLADVYDKVPFPREEP